MLWLYLLGAVTFLIIALRRVLRRQKPLANELYSNRVAIDHVQSGVAWVRGDGTLGSVNQSLADSLQRERSQFVGKNWLELFAEDDRPRASAAYSEMLLMGKTRFEACGVRRDDIPAWFRILLVAVHDHSMRFVGHHCLILDCTREHELAARLSEVETAIATAH